MRSEKDRLAKLVREKDQRIGYLYEEKDMLLGSLRTVPPAPLLPPERERPGHFVTGTKTPPAVSQRGEWSLRKIVNHWHPL